MSDAEIFLIAWAVIATVVAGLFASRANKEKELNLTLMGSILDVAKGDAELKLVGNRLTIKHKEYSDDDSTSK